MRRQPIDRGARTAIVMPICNEDVATVFAGLRATCESLAATGALSLFDIYVLSDSCRPGAARGRAAGLAAPAPDARRRRRARQRPRVLSLAAAAHAAQGRQRGRLLPPLGPQLPLHGGARRRQHHARRHAGGAGAADGSSNPRAGIVQTAAAGLRPRHRACASAAVRQPRHRPAVRAGHGLLAARRIALLGAQRHPAHRALHAPLRAGPAARPRRAGRRDPVARLRRSRADAPRRLRGLARAAPERQLGAAPGQPAGRTAARPPLVPGQPAERAAAGRTRLATGAPRHVRHRRAVVPGRTAVAGLRGPGPVAPAPSARPAAACGR